MPQLLEKPVRCFCGKETNFKGKHSSGNSRVTKYIYLCPDGHRITKNHAYKGTPAICPLCFRQCVNELDREAIQDLGYCLRCDSINQL